VLHRGNRGTATMDRGRLYALPVFYITPNDWTIQRRLTLKPHKRGPTDSF